MVQTRLQLTEDEEKFYRLLMYRVVSDPNYGQPFLSKAFYRLIPVSVEGSKTMSVDEHWRCYIDFAEMQAKGIDYASGILNHEIWHLLRSHHTVMDQLPAAPKGYHKNVLSNLAADIEINDDLLDLLPQSAIAPQRATFQQYRNNQTIHQYYNQMMGDLDHIANDFPSILAADHPDSPANAPQPQEKQPPEQPDPQEDKTLQKGDSSPDSPSPEGESSDESEDEPSEESSSSQGKPGTDEENSKQKPDSASSSAEEDHAESEEGEENSTGSGNDESDESDESESEAGSSGESSDGSDDQNTDEDSSGEEGSEGSEDSEGSEGSGNSQSNSSSDSNRPEDSSDSSSSGGSSGSDSGEISQEKPPKDFWDEGTCGGAAGTKKPYELPAEATDEIDNDEKEQILSDVAQAIEKSLQEMEASGKGVGSSRHSTLQKVSKWAKNQLKAKPTPWKDEFRGQFQQAVAQSRGKLTYVRSRPARRQPVPDIIYPALRSPNPTIGLAIDVSGSNLGNLQVILVEIMEIMKAAGVRGKDILAFTVNVGVSDVKPVNNPMLLLDKLPVGGGTRMRPGYVKLAELGQDISILITDGYVDDYPKEQPKGRKKTKFITCIVDDENSYSKKRNIDKAKKIMGKWCSIISITTSRLKR
jgi:predicted metal-dependent peptidase